MAKKTDKDKLFERMGLQNPDKKVLNENLNQQKPPVAWKRGDNVTIGYDDYRISGFGDEHNPKNGIIDVYDDELQMRVIAKQLPNGEWDVIAQEEQDEFDLDEKDDKWIQKAVDPAHKGYCTPMTKDTCTPARKAFAKRAKAGDLEENNGQVDPDKLGREGVQNAYQAFAAQHGTDVDWQGYLEFFQNYANAVNSEIQDIEHQAQGGYDELETNEFLESVRQKISEYTNENYPWGAKDDPAAPWNEPEFPDDDEEGYEPDPDERHDIDHGELQEVEPGLGAGVKFRAEVTGKGENRWSGNAMEYDTEEEAKEWLNNLANRWFGYDMSRVVPVTVPTGQQVDMVNDVIYQNFRN